MLAPATLGFAAGLLTGQTDADSTVVAAVLPAILTGAGGALLAMKIKAHGGAWSPDYVVAALSVVLFSAFLVIGLYSALALNEQDEHLDRRDEYFYKIQCSRNEYIVNRGRLALGLDPLPMEAFCNINPYSIPVPPK